MSRIKTNTVQNLKAIGDFKADFNGCTAIITGKNDGGKSSFIKSLMDRIRGIKPPIVLKTGTDEGFQEIELTTGEIFRWTFDNKTAKGERLIFITKDANGEEIKNSISQEIAKKYFPPTFDIDEFLLATPAKQRKILQNIVGLDFSDIDDRYKVAYEERTYANKKLSEAKLHLKPIDPSIATEELDASELHKKIAGIDHHNANYKTAYDGVHGKNGLKDQLADAETEIKRLTTLLNAANQKKKEIDGRISKGEKWLADKDNQPKGDDESFALNTELQNIIDTNEKIKANNKAIATKDNVLAMEIEAKKCDADVKKIELEKTKLIESANMPEGFAFSDDGILYRGLPVDKSQLSSSAIYIAALKLASMTVGDVRTLYFDASLLDMFKLKEIEQWAVENDFQLLIEKVNFEGGDIQYHLVEDVK